MKRIFFVTLALALATTGCVASEDADPATDTTGAPEETLPADDVGGVDAAALFSPDTTPFLSCHPGEVGDTRWMGTACCNVSPPSKRQYLYRCDGRSWQKTVQTRCIAGTCAM